MNVGVDRQVCPVCSGSDTNEFFCQYKVPTQCGYLAPTREQALNAPVGDITLRHCRTCSHVWNSAFDPDRLGFNSDYDFSQYYSPTYRGYVESVIERLKSRYDLNGKTALDIGCGKGDFMRMLIAAGFSKVTGFDPTYVEGSLSEDDLRQITVHKKFYDQSERALRPDLVTCRSVLQYVPQPRHMLQTIRETLEGQFESILCFEVPNGAEAFRDRMVWYVGYEAGCFFSAASLARLYRECGFQVIEVMSSLEGVQLEIEARPDRAPVKSVEESDDSIAEVARDIEGFAVEYATQVETWSARFSEARLLGKKGVLWGAGMRAVSLLSNVPASTDCIEFVVDVNPLRQNRFLPKTGQRVIAPEELVALRPDLVIASNPHYAREIEEQLRSLGITAEFCTL